jgi:hypothetical protein
LTTNDLSSTDRGNFTEIALIPVVFFDDVQMAGNSEQAGLSGHLHRLVVSLTDLFYIVVETLCKDVEPFSFHADIFQDDGDAWQTKMM